MLQEITKLWIHFHFDTRQLSDRIRVQKTLFLLKTLGYPRLDYSFSWYLFGPYSPAAARDVFCVQEKRLFETTKPTFTQEETAALWKFEKLLRDFDAATSNKASTVKYELFADIIFLRREKKDKDTIFKELSAAHTYLNDRSAFDTAWGLLVNQCMI